MLLDLTARHAATTLCQVLRASLCFCWCHWASPCPPAVHLKSSWGQGWPGQIEEEELSPLYVTICWWHVRAVAWVQHITEQRRIIFLYFAALLEFELAPKVCIHLPCYVQNCHSFLITQALLLGPVTSMDYSSGMRCLLAEVLRNLLETTQGDLCWNLLPGY